MGYLFENMKKMSIQEERPNHPEGRFRSHADLPLGWFCNPLLSNGQHAPRTALMLNVNNGFQAPQAILTPSPPRS